MTPAGARATKDRLLTAAAALFAEHGFHGTKIRDIAARARVNVAAQAYFCRSVMPAMLLMLGEPAYPPGFSRELAEHVTEFSLGGMERLAPGTRRARRTA